MKKILSVVIASVILISSFCIGSEASFNSLLETEADIVLLVNTDSDTVIFDKNADKQSAPASLTKIVTCILALEHFDDLNTPITCELKHIEGLYLLDASTAGIRVGETLTVEQLLYCLMLPSGGDAANILAYSVAGSIEEFVVMMNDFCKGLGCENTNFINAHGLDGDGSGYTTANDLYKITKYALQNPVFKKITSTPKYQLEGRSWAFYNTNKMMNPGIKDYYCPYVSGVKTGSTDLAGHCVVTVASKNGYNYMLIVMNAPQYDIDNDGVDENVAFTDSKRIYEWAFDNITLTKITNRTDVVTVVDVEYNWTVDHLRLLPAEELSALVPTGTQAGSLVIRPIPDKTPTSVKAPIEKGEVLGKAEVLYGEDVVATVDLVAAESVSRSLILWLFGILKTIVSTTVFKILFAILTVLIVIYILLIIRRNRLRAKKRKIKMVKG